MTESVAVLFGSPVVHTAQGEVPLAPERRFQVLAYLALRGGWVPREQVAALFWPEHAAANARGNLRFMLSQIKRLPWLEGFTARTDALRWEVVTDVQRFERALADGDRPAALDLYRGTLADGFEGDASVPFVEWLNAERKRMHGRWRDAVLEMLRAQPQPPDAADLAARLLAADPLDEAALQVQMRSLAASGDAALADRAYREFARRLAEELGIEPSNETRSLQREISGADSAQAQRLAAVPAPAEPGFFGRVAEQRQLAALILRPDCRLLTVIGPGGIGKSSLVARAAAALGDSFRDGVVIVPLEDVASPQGIGARLARALALDLSGTAAPLDEVIERLRPAQTLLVLDNFEHLVGGKAIVPQLLQQCPGIKLIVTSRIRLDVPGETMLPLDGLPFPLAEDETRAGDFDAVRMFVERARRTRAGFDPVAEMPAIAQICRLVEGLPLALEIAAAWTRMLPSRAIADEIRAGSELLRIEDPQRSPRQASVDTTLTCSWSMLAPVERDALARLSVFRGGFTRDAAHEVAGASLPVLASLVDRSLVRAEKGRFALHPLVGQFAAARLLQASGSGATARAHAGYFARFLRQQALAEGAEQTRSVAAIDEELENLRGAWNWALENGSAALLEGVAGLARYFDRRGRFAEGLDLFAQAEARLAGAPEVLAPLWGAQALLLFLSGRNDASEHNAQRALAGSRAAGNTREVKRALSVLGQLAMARSCNDDAARAFSEGMQVAAAEADEFGRDVFRGLLAVIRHQQQRFEESIVLLHESIAFRRQRGDRLRLVDAMHSLGAAQLGAGRPTEAVQVLTAALAESAAPDLGVLRHGILIGLADAHFALENLDAARDLLREAGRLVDEGASSYQAIDGTLLLARVHTAQREFGLALSELRRAAQGAVRTGLDNLRLSSLVHLAEWLLAQDRRGEARPMLELALRHPGLRSLDRKLALQTAAARKLDLETIPYEAERDEARLSGYIAALLARGVDEASSASV